MWLLPSSLFAFHDTRRPIDEVVYAKDTSTGEGEGSMSRYGGYSVTTRQFGTQLDGARSVGSSWSDWLS